MTRDMNPELLQALRFFTRETGIMSGLLLVCGSGGRTEAAMAGDVRENSVFDLASLTKLFTGLCVLRLKPSISSSNASRSSAAWRRWSISRPFSATR